MLQVCDAKTLAPKRMLNYGVVDPELSGFGICAHPPKDRARGLTFNYLISAEGAMYVFGMNIRSNPAKLIWKTRLPCPPCYIHSLAMTDRYVVFIRNVSHPVFQPLQNGSVISDIERPVQPLHMDVSDLSKQVMEMIEYEPESPTMFFVLDKFTGEQ
jgi:carotenoid cleavage dioxygenase-like enzyme